MEEVEVAELEDRAEFANFPPHAEEEIEEDSAVRLTEGIDLSRLASGETFEVADDFVKRKSGTGWYKPEDTYDYLDSDAVDCGEDDDSSPFDRLAETMVPVTEDNGVMKKVLKQGVENKVTEGAFVRIHYNAYVEHEDAPYDSTRIKNRPTSFRLSKEGDSLKNVIWGVDLAVASMHKKERSKFLIRPEYAYGKLGCAPRIPPQATLLYDIELIDFTDTIGLDVYYSLSAAEKKDAPFDLLKEVVERERKEGNDRFAAGHRQGAITKYKRAIQRLEECRLKDEEEENIQRKLLLRTSLNIGVCYMKEKMPKKCLTATNRAISIDRNNAKAYYLRGKALIQLAEFDRAKEALNKAREIKPRDKDILRAFQELEQKYKKYNMDERKLCQAMFGLKTDGKRSSDTTLAYTEEFKAIMHSQIQDFVGDEDMTELPLPKSTLTTGEVQCIKDIAKEFELEVVEIGVDSNAHYRIKKPTTAPSGGNTT